MCHFLSHPVVRVRSRFHTSTGSSSGSRVWLTFLIVNLILLSSSFAQQPLLTSHADNTRSNANTNETLLAPSNVNQYSFGRLFSVPVDYVVMAQPLYVPNVNMPGQGTHNVVYIVTQADSVYAIDADNGAQLWYASMLNVGGTTASGKYLPCGTAPGFNQEGIVGTPVIDPNTNTMYLVAKTLLNTTVRHHLHALDITTGNEQAGSPVLITAKSTSNKGHVTNFNSLHQKNRPGLLLLNGVLYMGFGSNFCNDGNSGWVLSYDPTSLSQLNVFNTSPDYGLTSIWQAGSGLAADDQGNIFVETAEAGAHGYDVPQGGQTYCNSVIKLSPTLEVADYFTPWYEAFLNSNDLDLSSTGAIVLPDQSTPVPELIAGGKEGVVYVLNRDNMGMYSANDSQIIQELSLNPNVVPGQSNNEIQFGAPAYWNNTVYFAPNGFPLTAFPVLPSGLLGTPLTTGKYSGSHSPSISANGNNNGIVWVIEGPNLLAFNAVTLKQLYGTNQAPNGRDKLPPVGHFVTQTVANGRVYVATQNSLEIYGLYQLISVTGGSNQTATVNTALSAPLQFEVENPYSQQPVVGATVTFSDGCTKPGATTCGSFNPPSAVTDSSGNVSTTYTVPQKTGTYSLTAALMINGTASGSIATSATATPAAAAKIFAFSGSKQTGSTGFNLPKPLVAQVQDAYKNGVPGVTVTFTSNKGGVPNPSSAVTGATGLASTTLLLPSTPATVTVTATFTPQGGSTQKVTFTETAVAPVATTLSISNGNSQSAAAGTQLPQALSVLVRDQFGNPFSGDNVNFSDGGAGGTFSNPNPVATAANGTATQVYTLPTLPSSITITATAAGISSPVTFTETSVAGPAANLTITGGNYQLAPAGTQLPGALTVQVTDQYGNPVAGVSVGFSDGGGGGSFSNPNPGTSDSTGTVTQFYTLPATPGGVTIAATAAGVSNPVYFFEQGQ